MTILLDIIFSSDCTIKYVTCNYHSLHAGKNDHVLLIPSRGILGHQTCYCSLWHILNLVNIDHNGPLALVILNQLKHTSIKDNVPTMYTTCDRVLVSTV